MIGVDLEVVGEDGYEEDGYEEGRERGSSGPIAHFGRIAPRLVPSRIAQVW